MSRLLTFAAYLTGSDKDTLAHSTPACRTKVKAMALAIMIPALIWASSGFMFSLVVMGSHILTALATGTVLGFIILTIERLIVMGNGNWKIAVFRLCLALLIAILGAQLFDLVLFKEDIDHVMPELRHETALSSQKMAKNQWAEKYSIADKENNVKKLWEIFQQRQQEASDESAGLSSNKQKGAGSATKFKQGLANQAKADYSTAKHQLDIIEGEAEALQQKAYDSSYAKFNDKSLLFRMKAMKMMLDANPAMQNTYIVITALLIFIELLVLVFKLTWPETGYEKHIKMLQALAIRRIDLMGEMAVAKQQPHQIDPVIRKASKNLQARVCTLL